MVIALDNREVISDVLSHIVLQAKHAQMRNGVVSFVVDDFNEFLHHMWMAECEVSKQGDGWQKIFVPVRCTANGHRVKCQMEYTNGNWGLRYGLE